MRNRNEVLILVVDDEDGIRESLTTILELEGFKAVSASGGIEAIDLLRANKIDFVISDVRMPHGDGVYLLKYVKENFPDIPHIVLISGFAEITVKEVKELGGVDLLSKPQDIDLLIEMIKSHCQCN